MLTEINIIWNQIQYKKKKKKIFQLVTYIQRHIKNKSALKTQTSSKCTGSFKNILRFLQPFRTASMLVSLTSVMTSERSRVQRSTIVPLDTWTLIFHPEIERLYHTQVKRTGHFYRCLRPVSVNYLSTQSLFYPNLQAERDTEKTQRGKPAENEGFWPWNIRMCAAGENRINISHHTQTEELQSEEKIKYPNVFILSY